MLLREYLQSAHSLSRRKFTDMIDQGQILLDEKRVESYTQNVFNEERLTLNDEKYKIDEKVKLSGKKLASVMVLFNKPMGYVVSKSDPHNMTIYELLPKEFQGFYYIGRLDKDSHGLLLLTNDPKMVNEFEHPKFEMEKEYIVKIDRPITLKDIQKMRKGIEDAGDLLKVHKVEGLRSKVKDHFTDFKTLQTLRLVLHEGKKRHIRRIFKAMGYAVVDLQRVREGKFELGDLKVGERRKINSKF